MSQAANNRLEFPLDQFLIVVNDVNDDFQRPFKKVFGTIKNNVQIYLKEYADKFTEHDLEWIETNEYVVNYQFVGRSIKFGFDTEKRTYSKEMKLYIQTDIFIYDGLDQFRDNFNLEIGMLDNQNLIKLISLDYKDLEDEAILKTFFEKTVSYFEQNTRPLSEWIGLTISRYFESLRLWAGNK